MKCRIGFVSNSSSSSFIVTDKEHPGYLYLLELEESGLADFDIYYKDEHFPVIEDFGDNGTWNAIWNAPVPYEWEEFLSQQSFNG